MFFNEDGVRNSLIVIIVCVSTIEKKLLELVKYLESELHLTRQNNFNMTSPPIIEREFASLINL